MAAQACTSTNSGVPARRRLRAAGKAVIATQHHGPRRCTDLFFLILFLGALGLLGYLLVYSLTHADLPKVIYGQDYMSDLCGVDNSVNTTGVPPIVPVTSDDQTLLQLLWPFSSHPSHDDYRLLRGQRDHKSRRFLYYTFPAGAVTNSAWDGTAVCLSECPSPSNTSSAYDDPAQWICTGRFTDFDYSNECLAPIADGRVEPEICIAYRAAFYVDAGDAVLQACQALAKRCARTPSRAFPRAH